MPVFYWDTHSLSQFDHSQMLMVLGKNLTATKRKKKNKKLLGRTTCFFLDNRKRNYWVIWQIKIHYAVISMWSNSVKIKSELSLQLLISLHLPKQCTAPPVPPSLHQHLPVMLTQDAVPGERSL